MITIFMKLYLYVSKINCNHRKPILFHLKKTSITKGYNTNQALFKSFNKQNINEHRMSSFKISYLSIDLLESDGNWMNIK